jgi:hypothetical protein
MRFLALKKRLVLESVLAALVLMVVGGLTYFLQTIQDDTLSSKTAIEGEVRMLTNETNNLREKYIKFQKNQDLYQKVLSLNNADMLSHNTGLLAVKFKEYEDRYNLNRWSFDNQRAPEPLDAATYQRKTNVIVLRNASFMFEGISDVDIFNMMRDMKKDFPGAISFASFKMVRDNLITDEILRTITQRGSYALVSGDIQIKWYAIEPTDPEELKRQSESNRRPRRRR